MEQVPSFVISEYTNPSGEIVFRASGWSDGKRIRKNFATRAEAEAERQVLEIQRLQADAGVRVAATRLTAEQLKEAEAAFCRLAGQPQSLSFWVDFALANYRQPQNQKLLTEAVVDYVGAKTHEFEQKQISAVDDVAGLRDIQLLRGGSIVVNLLGTFGHSLKETRLTAMLG